MLKEYHNHLLTIHVIFIGFEPFLCNHLETPVRNEFYGALEESRKEQAQNTFM